MIKQLITIALVFSFTNALAQLSQEDSLKSSGGIIKRTKILLIPLLSFNRSQGTTIGVIGNAFTVINPKDRISPPSRTTLGIGYTTTKSWFGFASQKLFLKEDKWRAFWALGIGKSNFQFFEETDDLGNGVFIDYQTNVNFISTTITRNISGRFYAGLKYQYSKSTTEFDDETKPNETAILSGLGIPMAFDNRDYVYYPSKGWLINGTVFSNMEWLGSDQKFSYLMLNANNFHAFNKKMILASRFYSYTGLGTIPFVGEKVIGGKDLRGYTQGEYRSNAVIAIQTELRYNFHHKWGMVGFGGIAAALKNDKYDGSGLLPAIGLGARYLALPKQKMNIAMDVAVGKGDWGFYLRVGEAF